MNTNFKFFCFVLINQKKNILRKKTEKAPTQKRENLAKLLSLLQREYCFIKTSFKIFYRSVKESAGEKLEHDKLIVVRVREAKH